MDSKITTAKQQQIQKPQLLTNNEVKTACTLIYSLSIICRIYWQSVYMQILQCFKRLMESIATIFVSDSSPGFYGKWMFLFLFFTLESMAAVFTVISVIKAKQGQRKSESRNQKWADNKRGREIDGELHERMDGCIKSMQERS